MAAGSRLHLNNAHPGVGATAPTRCAACTATVPSPATLDQSFSYDYSDRLTSNGANNSSFGYTYDSSGNRTQIKFGSNAYANTISPTSNRLMSTVGPVPAKMNTFDLAGNLLSDGTVTYTLQSAQSDAKLHGRRVNDYPAV